MPLFNGTDLTGWQGDPRIWTVEDGSIVAHGDRNPASNWRGNTYLVHQGNYTDFELKLQFKLSKGNSGVQFRSVLNDNKTMHGYQAEIGFDRGGKDLTGASRKKQDEASSPLSTIMSEIDSKRPTIEWGTGMIC